MEEISKVHVMVEQGALPLTVVRAGGAGAVVIVIPSAFGIAPDVERQMVEMASSASIVVALDVFFREDPGFVSYDDMARVVKRLEGLDRDRYWQDVRAAISWVREVFKGKRIVALGVCMGGPAVFRAAAEGLVDGVVTWHGTWLEKSLDQAAKIQCPMQLHFGATDPWVPAEAVAMVRQAFAGHDNVHVIVHEGATHGFSHPSAKAYDEKAERAGMDSVRELVVDAAQQGRTGFSRESRIQASTETL